MPSLRPVDVFAFLIGAGGLAVAALSLVLTYRERSRFYREHLYSKQADALLAIHRAASELQHEIGLVAVRSDDAGMRGKPFDDAKYFGPVRAAERALRDMDAHWAPILPGAVLKALITYESAVGFLLGTDPELGLSAEHGMGEDPYTSAMWYHGTDERFGELSLAVRRHFAIRKLDAQTERLLGVKPDDDPRVSFTSDDAQTQRKGRGPNRHRDDAAE